jgi:transposase-like protein
MVEQRYQAIREVLDTPTTISDVASRYGVEQIARVSDVSRSQELLASSGITTSANRAAAAPAIRWAEVVRAALRDSPVGC